MIKSRQYRQYNSNVTFDVYQYNYLNENDTPLQITTNNIYTINGSLVIYIKFNDLDLLNIDKLNYLFINLWLDDLSSIDSNNTFEFKLFQTSISNDNPLDTVRVCDTIFNDNNLIDKFTLNNGDRCVRLKILKSDLIYSRIYMIQVKPLDNMCVANLKGINEYNDLLYPLVITYYEDMRYKDDNINKDISMKNGINSKIDIQSLTTIAHVPLQSIQSNFINCSFSFYIGKEYDFKKINGFGNNAFHSYEYYIETVSDKDLDDLEFGDVKYKIYAPNGEEYVFYFGEVDNDEYLPLFPWDYEDRILDNDKLEFYNLENNTIKLIYYQDDQQFVLEDINKNKIYFKKSIATKNSRINYLKVEYIEYNNGKSIEFDYENTTSIKISQIVTNDGKIYIDYFANGLIKKVSNSENSNNINFDYEEYEITTNNYVYRIKNITVNETLISGGLYESDIITFSYKNTSDFPNLIDKISDIRSRENIKYHYNNQGKIIKVDFYLENSNFFNTSIEFEKESNNTKVITNNNYIYYVFDNYGCVLYQMDNNGKIMSYQYDKTLPQYDTNKKLISKNSINAYSRNLIYDNFIYDYETFFNNDSLKGWKKVICENYIVTNNQIIKEGQYSVLMNQESEIERVVIGDFNNELSLSFNYKTIGNFINAYCKISLDNGKTYQINLKNSGGNWDKAIINGIEAENAISIRINIYFNGYNLYLDNIQLGNNVSTHTNLMHNGFFEFGSETYQNRFWNFEDNSENALIVTCENDNLHPNATLGSKVLYLNNATTSPTIADTKINITGKKGDIFTFSALVKQISNYSSDEVKIELCFNYNTPVEILKTNPYTNNWQPITKVFTADEDYDCINIRLINNTSSQVYFDGIQIIKDEVGEYYEYDDNNRIIKVNSRNTIAFEYDGFGHLLGVKDGDGNGNNYLYNNEGKLIESMDYSLKGLMYFYDENGNIIRNVDKYVNDKILSAYEYNETNNFLLSKEFNERGQEKQYYYHLNNYLQQERYISSNKIINYEYNNLNNLSSLNVIDSEDSERIYYTYNNTNKKDQLTGISGPGLNYVNYNENYNTGILSVAFQEVGATTSLLNFVSMSYSNDGLLISKKYGISGTIYNFEYNNSNNLSNVKVNNSIKYHYSYDSLGNVVGIDDYVNNNRTQFSYDDKNNLTNYDDKYISVKYYYDKTNTINKSTFAQLDSIRSYEYYFNKDYNINNFESLISYLAVRTRLDYICAKNVLTNKGTYGMTFSNNLLDLNRPNLKYFGIGYGRNLNINLYSTNENNIELLVNKERNDEVDVDNFKHHKWIYLWVNIGDAYLDSDFVRLYFKNESTLVDNIVDIKVEQYGKLFVNTPYGLTNSETRISNQAINNNEWTQIVLSIKDIDNAPGKALLNIYINGEDSGINRIVDGTDLDDITKSYCLYKVSLLSKSNSGYSVAYIGVGSNKNGYELSRDNKDNLSSLELQQDLYNKGKNLIEESIINIQNTIYYNSNVYENFEVITLLGNEKGSKGCIPSLVTYKDNIDNGINSLFKRTEQGFYYHIYDDDSPRLSYIFDYIDNFSFGLFFRTYSNESLKTVVSFKLGSQFTCTIYTDNSNIYLNNNDNIINLSSLELNTWTHVFIVKDSNTIKIYINGTLGGNINVNTQTLSKYIEISLGRDFNNTNYLNGYIKMLCYSGYASEESKIIEISTKGHEINYKKTFDGLGRISNISVYTRDNKIRQTADCIYLASSIEGYTTSILNNYGMINGEVETLIFDNNNQIIYQNNKSQYRYDQKNRLKLEYNDSNQILYLYSYDKNGNILNRKKYQGTLNSSQLDNIAIGTLPSNLIYKEVIKYTYNSVIIDNRGIQRHFKDLLTKYEIYDIINNVEVLQKCEECTYSSSYYGNPETIKGYISTFEGRRLIRLAKPDINEDIQYTYNDRGLRTNKVIISTDGYQSIDYYYEGDRLISYRNNENKMIYIHYDETGKAIGFHYEGNEYIYVRDSIGNIVKIMDINGQVVAEYAYNAWGEVVSEGGSNNIHQINILMYKGYVYDRETGLFWLSSRYYSPELCRFLRNSLL